MKREEIITRKDGSQVRIVAELLTSPAGDLSIGNYVMHRKHENEDWTLCKTPPFQTEFFVSIEHYINHQRPEMLRIVSPVEILKVNKALLDIAKQDINNESGERFLVKVRP